MPAKISFKIIYQRISDRSKLLAKVIYEAIRDFSVNDGTNMAASISFYIVLSFIPVLLLSISLVGFFAGNSPLHFDQIITKIRIILPFIDERMTGALRKTVAGREAIGGGGIIILLWSANKIFTSSERVLNRIFQIKKKRGYVKSNLIALGLALALGLSLVISVGLGIVASLVGNVQFLSGLHVERILDNQFLVFWAPLVLLTVSFSVLVVILPHGKIYFRYALVGGAVFAALFEFAKNLFTFYIMKFSSVNLIYGSLGSIIIIILWVFYSSILFIFSAEFVSVIQFRAEEEKVKISLAELEETIPLAN